MTITSAGDTMERDILIDQLHITKIIRVFEAKLMRQHLPFSSPRTAHCFIFTLAGGCVFTLKNGTVLNASAGDLVYLSEGVDYAMDIQSDQFHYYNCIFRAERGDFGKCFSATLRAPQEFENLFRRLYNAYSVSAPARKLMCLSLLYRIYAQIVQDSNSGYVPGSAKAKIDEARVYIQTHLPDLNLQISVLAEKAGFSEAHFRKIFRDQYGVSPAKFITGERIAFAKKLLELEKMRLEDIALQSGFSSLPYFCKVFKAETGVTPGIYRKKLQ